MNLIFDPSSKIDESTKDLIRLLFQGNDIIKLFDRNRPALSSKKIQITIRSFEVDSSMTFEKYTLDGYGGISWQNLPVGEKLQQRAGRDLIKLTESGDRMAWTHVIAIKCSGSAEISERNGAGFNRNLEGFATVVYIKQPSSNPIYPIIIEGNQPRGAASAVSNNFSLDDIQRDAYLMAVKNLKDVFEDDIESYLLFLKKRNNKSYKWQKSHRDIQNNDN